MGAAIGHAIICYVTPMPAIFLLYCAAMDIYLMLPPYADAADVLRRCRWGYAMTAFELRHDRFRR